MSSEHLSAARAAETSGAYERIEDYALIGDCRAAALVSRTGSIDWLCWPRFDSPWLFGRLLDADRGGCFSLRPAAPFESERRYAEGTNILETTFRTATGSVRLTDLFFGAGEDYKRRHLLPVSMLIRRLEGIEGEAPMELLVDPVLEYGGERPRLELRGEGFLWNIRNGVVSLACPAGAEWSGSAVRSGFSVREGDRRDFVLSLDETSPAVFPPMQRLDELIELTAEYWRLWAARVTYKGRFREEVIRSALALKLLTYSPSGAIIAAPTSSLPERIGGPYNWDYRFCWLRDASYTVRALLAIGLREEAMAFLQWLLHATRLTLPRMQVVYDVFGRPLVREREIEWLEGYGGSRPVRIGNAAHTQFQLDVYGAVMDAAYLSLLAGSTPSKDECSLLEGLVRFVMEHWREPDDGIWETRLGSSQYVHSKVMCWVALDRACLLAERGLISVDRVEVRRTVDEIADLVRQRGFSENLRSYTSVLDGSELDASALALSIFGFESANEPRMAATIDALLRRLSDGDLVFRHRNRETEDEGAFLICSFWLVECLAQQGRLREAEETFARLCDRANDVGLLPEEISPSDGRFLGNFPQAFSHIGLINAALALQAGGKVSLGGEEA